MTAALPFSQAIRERTWPNHSASEHATFMVDLIRGRAQREDYTALVAQHYFIYRALEHAAATMAADPVASRVIHPELTRLPALEADLAFLVGPGWKDAIRPLPATERYVERLESTAATWGGGFVAHHYTRYLGDLSGGQYVARVMRRSFGLADDGVRFYEFPAIPDPEAFKNDYRRALDTMGWSAAEQDRVIDEVLLAYDLNTAVFEDLQSAKESAVA